MAFEQSVGEAAMAGLGDVLKVQKGFQEAAVRPRELEAATSMRESLVKEQQTKMSNMETMAGLDKQANEAREAAGEKATAANSARFRIEAYAKAGKGAEAVAAQKELNTLDSDGMKLESSAIELAGDKNDLMSSRLGAVRSVKEFGDLAREQLVAAEHRMRGSAATEQDAAAVRRLRASVADADGWERSAAEGSLRPEDATFAKFRELEIAPLMKSLKSTKRQDAEAKAELDAEHKKAVLEQTKNHQETMAGLARQGLAIKRDGLTASNEHKDRVAAGKVAGKKLERENLILKYEKELNDVQFQQPTITTTPEVASTFGFGGKAAVKVANPRIAVLQEAIDKLKVDSLLEEDAVVLPPATEGDKLAKPEAVVGVREPLPSEAKGKAPGRYKLAGGDEIQVHSDGTFTALTKGTASPKTKETPAVEDSFTAGRPPKKEKPVIKGPYQGKTVQGATREWLDGRAASKEAVAKEEKASQAELKELGWHSYDNQFWSPDWSKQYDTATEALKRSKRSPTKKKWDPVTKTYN